MEKIYKDNEKAELIISILGTLFKGYPERVLNINSSKWGPLYGERPMFTDELILKLDKEFIKITDAIAQLVRDGQVLCFPGFAPNITKLGEGTCLPDTYYKDAIYIDLSKPYLTQQLIYNGRINDSVKFLYRELSEGKLMRAPFTQEIQYDLKKGNEIGFKGARLKILEASNR